MSKRRHPSYLHMVMFAGVMAVTAYVILNLEFPRVGFGACARSTPSCASSWPA